jgi:hypothetical protein
VTKIYIGLQKTCRKHDDRVHSRKTCNFPGCSQSFGSKGELHRHKQTTHNQIPAHKLLACPESNCKYSLTPHFKRKDNFVDHLKRIHGFSQTDAKAKADSEAISQARSQIERQSGSQFTSYELPNPLATASSAAPARLAIANSSQQDRTHSTTPGPSKKRRLSKTALHPHESSNLSRTPGQESHDEEETWKRKAARYETEMEALRAQNACLKAQNDLLESRIQRLEANQDSLIAVLAERRAL